MAQARQYVEEHDIEVWNRDHVVGAPRTDLRGKAMYQNVRWRWVLIGAAVGASIVASDYFLEWRGPQHGHWIGGATISNVIEMLTVVCVPAFAGLVAGYKQDCQL